MFNPEQRKIEYQPKQLILPNGHEKLLDIRTLNYPKIEKDQAPSTDLHIVRDSLFSPDVTNTLISKGFALNNIESEVIATKAVATLKFPSGSRSQGYNVFQKCLLDPNLFANPEFRGYMEFESRNPELKITWKDFIDKDEFYLPQLEPKPVLGSNFKRGDLHFTVDRIDPRFERILINKGFYYADFTNKQNTRITNPDGTKSGEHRVLTIQSSRIKDTLAIKKELIRFVGVVGGASGVIKDEPVLLYVRTKDNAVPPCSNVRIR